MPPAAVTFDRISKRFPGVVALADVSFDVARGSCHAICGENGAGKSTLGKILAGIHQADSGQVSIDGRVTHIGSPAAALAAGVAIVHQELAFCGNLTVAENLCLGRIPSSRLFVSFDAMRDRARAMLAGIGAELDVTRPLGTLSIGQQQLVQIASAIGSGAHVIVFDEPTSSLSQHEAAQLYLLMTRLRERGLTCLFVSHRLEEIFHLCDTVTVLRDGRHVRTQPRAGLDRAALIEMMIGRRLEERAQGESPVPGKERLRVEGLSSPGRFSAVTFSLHAGEIVGCAGLVGAGRSEVAQAIFGLDAAATGRVAVDGKDVTIRSAGAAIALGIGLVPEDRKHQALVLMLSVLGNATLSIFARLSRLGFVGRLRERDAVSTYLTRLRVRVPSLDTPVAALSGGNQQKVVLTRWLAARCHVLIVDEPTRGVDVGAKAEIHTLLRELTAQGTAILLVSSEMPEILALSDRVLVFRQGRIVGEVPRATATQDGLMEMMA